MGFDYFYGFLGGETDQWTPFLFRNHTQIFPWIEKPGYNLITGMADDAINYLKEVKNAAPDKPFFLYYVPGGSHAPHQPTPEWIKNISDMHCSIRGWRKLRETTSLAIETTSVIGPARCRTRHVRRMPSPTGRRSKASEMGHAQCRREETFYPSGGRFCSLHGLYRL